MTKTTYVFSRGERGIFAEVYFPKKVNKRILTCRMRTVADNNVIAIALCVPFSSYIKSMLYKSLKFTKIFFVCICKFG